MKTKGFIRGVPYRLASFYGTSNYKEVPDDICLFTRAMLKGFGFVLLITLIGFLVCVFMIDTLFTSWFYLNGNGAGDFWQKEYVFFSIGCVLWFFVFLFGIFVLLSETNSGRKIVSGVKDWNDRRKMSRRHKEEKEPSIIKMWYHSVKNKVCFKINFED